MLGSDAIRGSLGYDNSSSDITRKFNVTQEQMDNFKIFSGNTSELSTSSGD